MRKNAFETLQELGISDSAILEHIIGNILTGHEADQIMDECVNEFEEYINFEG